MCFSCRFMPMCILPYSTINVALHLFFLLYSEYNPAFIVHCTSFWVGRISNCAIYLDNFWSFLDVKDIEKTWLYYRRKNPGSMSRGTFSDLKKNVKFYIFMLYNIFFHIFGNIVSIENIQYSFILLIKTQNECNLPAIIITV